MRTNIEIDDALLKEAMALTGAKTKKQAVHDALAFLVRLRKGQTGIRALRGKVEWDGDLDAMRRDT